MMMIAMSIAGCTNRLPTYTWIDVPHAVKVMAKRADLLKTISSPCRIILTDPNGSQTQLDGAIAARVPCYFRLRAWKFSEAVLDITLTPSGMWLFGIQDHDSNTNSASPFATLDSEQFKTVWSFATGALLGDGWTLNDSNLRNRIELKRDLELGGAIHCEIDRTSLTLHHCKVSTASNKAELTLTLNRYRRIGELVVPTQFVMASEQGKIAILLDDLAINEDLPPLAFDPPQRAIKQP